MTETELLQKLEALSQVQDLKRQLDGSKAKNEALRLTIWKVLTEFRLQATRTRSQMSRASAIG